MDKVFFEKKQIVSLILFSLLLYSLSIFLIGVQKTHYFPIQAKPKPANLVIDPFVSYGPVNPFWQALAQGGEEKQEMFRPVFEEVKALKPRFVRLDHLYDFYNVVNRMDGALVFDWQELDKRVDTILEMGALPFFSLSYMPPAIAQNGEIDNPPENWSEWQAVVRATVEHFSGRNQKDLKDIYYEVWNEPDLFGDWQIKGKKDYLQLYYFAAKAAQEAQNTNPFKIGGPATTGLYQPWVVDLINFIEENRLPLDFYSWHRYSPDPEVFSEDLKNWDHWLEKKVNYQSLPLIISEWSSDSELSVEHDNQVGAAHLVATVRQYFYDKIRLAFLFEAKDGPSPENKELWGRWGLLAHSGFKKPKYHAFQLLNLITGKRIDLKGEGTHVTAMASLDGESLNLLVVNYDPQEKHYERVPIKFVHLEGQEYLLEKFNLLGLIEKGTQKIDSKTFSYEISLEPNDIVFLRLTKVF